MKPFRVSFTEGYSILKIILLISSIQTSCFLHFRNCALAQVKEIPLTVCWGAGQNLILETPTNGGHESIQWSLLVNKRWRQLAFGTTRKLTISTKIRDLNGRITCFENGTCVIKDVKLTDEGLYRSTVVKSGKLENYIFKVALGCGGKFTQETLTTCRRQNSAIGAPCDALHRVKKDNILNVVWSYGKETVLRADQKLKLDVINPKFKGVVEFNPENGALVVKFPVKETATKKWKKEKGFTCVVYKKNASSAERHRVFSRQIECLTRQSVAEGESLTLDCPIITSLLSTRKVVWERRSGVTKLSRAIVTKLRDDSKVSPEFQGLVTVTQNFSVTFKRVVSSDNGVYTCKVMDQQDGSVIGQSYSVTLDVTPLGDILPLPKRDSRPAASHGSRVHRSYWQIIVSGSAYMFLLIVCYIF